MEETSCQGFSFLMLTKGPKYKQGPSGTNHGLGVNMNNDGPKGFSYQKTVKNSQKRIKKKVNNSQKPPIRSKVVKRGQSGLKRSKHLIRRKRSKTVQTGKSWREKNGQKRSKR